MDTIRGIGLGAWVNLDASCPVKPEVFGDHLQIEFGSGANSLGLVLSEDMVQVLSTTLTDALVEFREAEARG